MAADDNEMKNKALIGAVLAIVAVILIGISFTMPWYTVKQESSAQGNSSSIEWTFSLDEAKVESDIFNETSTDTIDYDDEEAENSTVVDTFQTTQKMNIAGVLGAVLGLLGGLMVAIEKMNKKIGVIIIVAGLILALIAPMYLMASLPGAFEEDDLGFEGDKGPQDSFMGSETEETTEGGVTQTREKTWGPALSWYFGIISVILLGVAAALIGLSKPSKEPRQQPRSQGPQAGEYQQTGQTQQGRREPPTQQQQTQQQPGQQQPQQQPSPGQQPRQQTQQQPGQQQAAAPGPAGEPAHTCSTCGRELRYVEEYDRWYCDNCQQYE